MEIEKTLDSIVWCKESWDEPSLSGEARELLRQCCEHASQPLPNKICLQDLIDNSNRFPIPFPVQTVRLEDLKANAPVERLERNARSTYPLIHERVLVLMANFLVYKRKYGSNIEKELYKDMKIPQLVERLLQKRAITFMKAQDQYKLITGEKGVDGWESVGLSSEVAPLVLSQCLSYDEMKLSAFLYVSGYTECINDGARNNVARVNLKDVERNAVIIGVIGPRFKRVNRMDYEDMLVTEDQNTTENGYGEQLETKSDDAKAAWRQMWAQFYQVPSTTHEQLYKETTPAPCSGTRVFSSRWSRVKNAAFDNATYHRRMQILFDTVLVETDYRAKEAGKSAFLNVIGAGLGVWKYSPHQLDIFVLSLLQRVRDLLSKGLIQHISDVNLGYIRPNKIVAAFFKPSDGSDDEDDAPKKLFLKSQDHPRGGINVQLQNREPSSILKGEHEGKLLVMIYPWDSNAHPGNEFWLGKLKTSGDPAAACSTQVSELHNAHINRDALRGDNTRVAGDNVRLLNEHCKTL